MADDEKDSPVEGAAPVAIVYVPFGHAVLCGIGFSIGASACAVVLWGIYVAMRLLMVVALNLDAER